MQHFHSPPPTTTLLTLHLSSPYPTTGLRFWNTVHCHIQQQDLVGFASSLDLPTFFFSLLLTNSAHKQLCPITDLSSSPSFLLVGVSVPDWLGSPRLRSPAHCNR